MSIRTTSLTAAAPVSGRPSIGRFGVTLAAFAGLALYGSARWATMLGPQGQGRVIALFALALCVAPLVHVARTASFWLVRVCAAVLVLALAIAMLPVSGLPARLVVHLRIAVLVRMLSHGIQSLPGAVVPYTGADVSTAAVIALGAGVLLLGGAVTLGACGRRLGRVRLAACAVPLLVLCAVPAAIARPHLAYVHGVITFGLLAALVCSQPPARGRAGSATLLIVLAAIVGAAGAAAVDHPAWLDVSRLGTGGNGNQPSGELFDWSQRYGPLDWPQTGANVLEVQAARPAYWKAEDLDGFDSRGWIAEPDGAYGTPPGDLGASPENLRRYEQTITVTVDDLQSDQVIGAGDSSRPRLPGAVPGFDDGTWETTSPISAGARYTERVYAPSPAPAQFAAARGPYPALLAPFRELTLGAAASAYAPVAALAQRLAAQAPATEYGYVSAVMAYLRHGFRYSLDPPTGGRYPIVRFLETTHVGYCQQFAGAMALLLRLDHIPARVAVGFTTGQLVGPSRYLVTDTDAHAWVEAWFPGFGWTAFDPTPGPSGTTASDAEGDALPAGLTAQDAHGGSAHAKPVPTGRVSSPSRTRSSGGGAAGGLSPVAIALLALIGGGLIAAGGALMLVRRRPADTDALVGELARALGAAGALPAHTTLDQLQRRFGDTPAAAAYLRALAGRRWGGDNAPIPAAGRAALRRRIARGEGLRAHLRVLIAMPPGVWRRPGDAS